MIQHTEDGAEAAICATMKPPAKWAYNVFCLFYVVVRLTSHLLTKKKGKYLLIQLTIYTPIMFESRENSQRKKEMGNLVNTKHLSI